jgi:hypothetical protein
MVESKYLLNKHYKHYEKAPDLALFFAYFGAVIALATLVLHPRTLEIEIEQFENILILLICMFENKNMTGVVDHGADLSPPAQQSIPRVC